MSCLIYAKRTGWKGITDPTFKALNSKGYRVNRLADAFSYATREDAEDILKNPFCQQQSKNGLIKYEIRRAR